MQRSRFTTLARPIFWALLIAIYVISIWPRGMATPTGDKVNHMLAFATLAVSARLAFPDASRWTLLVLLALFGAAIEATQMIPALDRQAELLDWVADVVAAVGGIVVVDVVRRLITLRSN